MSRLYSTVDFMLAGYAFNSHFDRPTIRLLKETIKDANQYEHYADDWDEEDDAYGWCPYR